MPGWNPEQMLELSSALEISAAASRLKTGKVSQQIVNDATNLAVREIGGLLGEQAGGATAIVVINA